MNKTITKLVVSILLFIGIIVYSNTMVAYASDDEKFKGEREVEYVIDSSDLDNYIAGGRSSIELLLRKTSPEWLEFDFRAENNDIYINLTFKFKSYKDYMTKLECLTYNKPIVVTSSNRKKYIEGFNSIYMLEFLRIELVKNKYLEERLLEDIVSVFNNRICINDKEYEVKNAYLSFLPDDEKVIKFSQLGIYTVENNDGTFKRNINIRLREHDEKVLDELTKRFEKVGKVYDESSLYDLGVEFIAKNKEQFIEKTIECLNVSYSLAEKQTYSDNNNVEINISELLDIDTILEDNGGVSYTYECPTKYDKIASGNENISIEDNVVNCKDIEKLEFSYITKFSFDSVLIHTDLKSFLGMKKRVITLCVPTEIATYYHESIKKQIKERLVRGTTFDIYDENGTRYYELSYSTWLNKELNKFTNAVLNSENNLEVEDDLIPFSKSSWKETFNTNKIVKGMKDVEKIDIEYELSKTTKILNNTTDNKQKVVVSDEKNICLEYRQISLKKIVVGLIIIVFCIIIVLWFKNNSSKEKFINAWKKVFMNTTEKITVVDQESEKKCSCCGGKVKNDDVFCENCGTKII